VHSRRNEQERPPLVAAVRASPSTLRIEAGVRLKALVSLRVKFLRELRATYRYRALPRHPAARPSTSLDRVSRASSYRWPSGEGPKH
jgi:hypothetical protein